MRFASTPRRPAVSTIRTSCSFAFACARPFAGDGDRVAVGAGARRIRVVLAERPVEDRPSLPRSGANTETPARSPTICSCCTAFGRCRSAATSSGVWPCFFNQSPSLPASVVLPEPCRPASMITVGGFFASRSRRVWPPRIPDQLVVDDLEDLLARVERAGQLRAGGPLADGRDEAADDGQRDVGLEQRDADLAADEVDVGRPRAFPCRRST